MYRRCVDIARAALCFKQSRQKLIAADSRNSQHFYPAMRLQSTSRRRWWRAGKAPAVYVQSEKGTREGGMDRLRGPKGDPGQGVGEGGAFAILKKNPFHDRAATE